MRDPRGDFGRLEGKAAHDQLSDTIAIYRFVFRLLTLPFWLPRRYWKRRKGQLQMIEFSRSLAVRGADGPGDVALRWVLAHPDEFVLGEYDPKLRKVTKKFRRIMKHRM